MTQVIWWCNPFNDDLDALKTVIESKLVTHIMLYGRHATNADWRKELGILNTIILILNSTVKLIWCRWLWPYDASVSLDKFFDPAYYIEQIKQLRFEDREIGADFVALDVEAYGASNMKEWTKGVLTFSELNRLRRVREQAIREVGKVDYILPCGSEGSDKAYNPLAGFGEITISESTYYDSQERMDRINYPYDVMGAFVDVTPGDDPNRPRYTIGSLFLPRPRREHIFIYQENALAVAKELLAYGKKKGKPE